MAGNWLFSGRRWRNPQRREDRDALIAGYDALVATFLVFSRCSRDRFLKIISGFCSSWLRSTRHGLPNLLDNHPAPTDDEWPLPNRDGSSSLGLESGSADLQTQRRGGKTIAHNVRMDYPLHPPWGLGAGPFAQDHASGTAEPEVTPSVSESRSQPLPPVSSVSDFWLSPLPYRTLTPFARSLGSFPHCMCAQPFFDLP
jgi:hypothetical protein